MSPDQLAKMTRCLIEGATVQTMVQATGLTRQTVSSQLKTMRQAGAAYIRSYAKDTAGRRTKAVWAVGGRPGLTKPTGITTIMRQRAYRRRKKAEAKAVSNQSARTAE